MNNVWRVFVREIRLVFLRKKYFALFVVWPLAGGLLFGGMYLNKVVINIPCAVFDQDTTKLSRMLTRYADATRSANIVYFPSDEESFKELMYAQKAVAGIHIPAGFQDAVKRGSSPGITLFVNGANLLTANLLISDLRAAAGTVSAGIRVRMLRKTGASRGAALAAQAPLTTDLTRLYNPGINYLYYLAPGIWLAVLQQVFLLFGVFSIARETDAGTFRELLSVADGRLGAIVLGKYAAYFSAAFLIMMTYFALYFPLFALPLRGNAFLLAAHAAAFILAVMSCGFLFSCALHSRDDAIKGCLLIGAPAFLLSGYTWPIASMPAWIRPVAHAIPLTPFLSGFKKIAVYGLGAGSVAGETGVLLLTTMLCTLAGLPFLAAARRRTLHDGV